MQISINELNFDDDSYQYMELLKQLTYIDPSIITNEMFEKQLSIIKNNPFHKIIVAKMDGKIVGSTTVLIEPKFIHNLSSVGHIEDVVVDQNYRLHGIGKLLIVKAIDICRQERCYKIILDCSDKVCGFYCKLGFTPKEKQMALYLNGK
ncbi:putative glucosamine 6-phosphate N-acetyltransferase [Acanthamoeba polyphaga mimivirus]|nr:putative glucosamine 6-phosphate N-acetyltransferase [Mimivirus reunion]WMV61671.1 putative glucosamine 6-phosphate N-acetyltransferase [Mimivirus sp.]WMV62648.1 putative glucosamine 6-phosphate N-acetyltransferase [Acanthamoeba polyphaga mimivirus]WMV63625.1 putative glucosamine 6-phosphate N-acetyltransferase [Mimivirus sp.]